MRLTLKFRTDQNSSKHFSNINTIITRTDRYGVFDVGLTEIFM